MSEQYPPEFEDRLRALLARAAEAIPADTDLSPRVQQAFERGAHRGSARAIAGSRHALATVAAVLVVSLLAGVLTFVRPGGLLRPAGGVTSTSTRTSTAVPTRVITPPTCTIDNPGYTLPPVGTPVDHSVAIGHHASLHGITITIDRAYADATQTVITYHMQTRYNPPLPASPVLIDAQGHRYGDIMESWGTQRGGALIFTPLPPDELGVPQTLTFFAQQMQIADPTGPAPMVDGPWKISFQLTPAAGTSIALSDAPLTRNGLTIQPLRLDMAPPGGGLDGRNGGARVVVRISGLAPGSHLLDALHFNTLIALNGGSSSSCGGGIFELALPNGQQIPPGAVHPLGQIVPLTPAEQAAAPTQTVGPSGTVDLEALFYTPIPAGASVTLYVDHVSARLFGSPRFKGISGPWEFQLPPSA